MKRTRAMLLLGLVAALLGSGGCADRSLDGQPTGADLHLTACSVPIGSFDTVELTLTAGDGSHDMYSYPAGGVTLPTALRFTIPPSLAGTFDLLVIARQGAVEVARGELTGQRIVAAELQQLTVCLGPAGPVDGGTDAGDGTGPDGAVAPHSFAFPGGGTYATPFNIALASDDPLNHHVVRYTTDGSAPSSGSAVAPLGSGVSFTPGTPVHFYAEGIEPPANFHSETYLVDSAEKGRVAFIPDAISIAGGGPLAVLTGADAPIPAVVSYQVWNPPGGGDVLQIIVAVGGEPTGCLYNAVAPAFPGDTTTENVSLNVPTAPGRYPIEAVLDPDFGCSQAMASFRNISGNSRRTIGLLIVQ
jgi:hypothetical protein